MTYSAVSPRPVHRLVHKFVSDMAPSYRYQTASTDSFAAGQFSIDRKNQAVVFGLLNLFGDLPSLNVRVRCYQVFSLLLPKHTIWLPNIPCFPIPEEPVARWPGGIDHALRRLALETLPHENMFSGGQESMVVLLLGPGQQVRTAHMTVEFFSSVCDLEC